MKRMLKTITLTALITVFTVLLYGRSSTVLAAGSYPLSSVSVYCDSIDEALALINNRDLSSHDISQYRDIQKERYAKMMDAFKNDGFIYNIKAEKATPDSDGMTYAEDRNRLILSYHENEDIGVWNYIMYGDELYIIRVYSADPNILKEGMSYPEYQAKKLQYDTASIDEGETIGNYKVYLGNNGRQTAHFFVDDSHYCYIETKASEEELRTFINKMTLEKIRLTADIFPIMAVSAAVLVFAVIAVLYVIRKNKAQKPE